MSVVIVCPACQAKIGCNYDREKKALSVELVKIGDYNPGASTEAPVESANRSALDELFGDGDEEKAE